MRLFYPTAAILAASLLSMPVWAGEADVVDVRVRAQSEGVYSFDVSVRHADDGWDHYADAFEIIGPDCAVLGTRILAHPHDNEQPFTRSLSGVPVPAGLSVVGVRARDLVHGLGGVVMQVPIPGH